MTDQTQVTEDVLDTQFVDLCVELQQALNKAIFEFGMANSKKLDAVGFGVEHMAFVFGTVCGDTAKIMLKNYDLDDEFVSTCNLAFDDGLVTSMNHQLEEVTEQ